MSESLVPCRRCGHSREAHQSLASGCPAVCFACDCLEYMPPVRPSSDTVRIDERELQVALVERGEAEWCPACGHGIVSKRVAARVKLALPSPEDRATQPTIDEETTR